MPREDGMRELSSDSDVIRQSFEKRLKQRREREKKNLREASYIISANHYMFPRL